MAIGGGLREHLFSRLELQDGLIAEIKIDGALGEISHIYSHVTGFSQNKGKVRLMLHINIRITQYPARNLVQTPIS